MNEMKKAFGGCGQSIMNGTGKSSFEDRGRVKTQNTRLSITDYLRQLFKRHRKTSPDFSLLDYLAWIKILSYLDQKDRLAVANTCTRLRNFCLSGGCLWRSLTMHVGWDMPGWKKNKMMTLNETEKQVLQISREKIQDVEFDLHICKYEDFDAKSFQCLDDASKTWYLRSFTFHVNHLCLYCQDFRLCPNYRTSFSSKQLLINCLTSENARGLKSLEADTQCLPDALGSPALFEVLEDSPFSHSLEKLVLDWNFHFQSLPPLTEDCMSALCSTVGQFVNLQKLKIPSAFLTDQLLEALSQPGRAGLQRITLLYGTFPEKLSSWPQVLESSPSLKVTVISSKMLRSNRIISALPPYVPVTKWSLMEGDHFYLYYSGWQRQLYELLPLYAQHLTHLRILAYDEAHRTSDKDLLLLITKCTKLKVLEFGGGISSDAILKIVAQQREWKKLHFQDRLITFPQTWEGDRDQKMARLCSEIPKSLRFSWKPSSVRKPVNSFSQDRKCRGVKVQVKPKKVYV